MSPKVPMLTKTPRRAAASAKKRLSRNKKQELQKQFDESRHSWLRRRRVHPLIFEEYLDEEEEQARKRIADELAKNLGLSGKRLARFKQLVVAYGREPTIENYVLVRREFPDVEIEVGYFGGPQAIFALESKLRAHGIDPGLVAVTVGGNEACIDALSLQLLEGLIARNKLPKDNGPGHIQRRRAAISDTTVNYLTSVMLEAMGRNGAEIRMPASLIVLIREQLSGVNPDLHNEYVSREQRRSAAWAAARHFDGSKDKMSVRKLARALGVSRSMAAQWLKDEEFMRVFESVSANLV